jgi:two-component system, NarL family, invasion response regulator UvrY
MPTDFAVGPFLPQPGLDWFMRNAIRVGIADDDEVIRLTLARVLATVPELKVVASVDRAAPAVALAQSGGVDVLVLDLEMPGMGGFEALRLIRALAPNVRVIMHSSRRASEVEAQMLEGGATAYLQKPCDVQQMANAIRAAAAAGSAVT